MRADMGRKERWERKENLSFKEKSPDTQTIDAYPNGTASNAKKPFQKTPDPPEKSLLEAKNGLDNGVHFTV